MKIFSNPYFDFAKKNAHLVWILVLVIIMLVSFFGLYHLGEAGSLDQENVLASIDASKKNVDRITLVSAGTATALALVPDDSTTPVANQIASISSKLICVSIVLFIEEIIAKIASTVCFRWCIPIACILIICTLTFLKNSRFIKAVAIRLIAAGLCLFFILPAGVFINNQIDSILNFNEKLETLFSASSEVVDDAEEYSNTVSESETANDTESESQNEEQKKGFAAIGNWISNAWKDTTDWVTGAVEDVGNTISNVTTSASNLLKKAGDLYSLFLSAAVVMIIKDFVVPIAMFILLVWIFKALFTSLLMPEYAGKHGPAIPDGKKR